MKNKKDYRYYINCVSGFGFAVVMPTLTILPIHQPSLVSKIYSFMAWILFILWIINMIEYRKGE